MITSLIAKQFTVEHLRAAKSVVLKDIKRGKYFRLIADVYLDGVSLGEQLIKQGHAVRYQGEAKHEIVNSSWVITTRLGHTPIALELAQMNQSIDI